MSFAPRTSVLHRSSLSVLIGISLEKVGGRLAAFCKRFDRLAMEHLERLLLVSQILGGGEQTGCAGTRQIDIDGPNNLTGPIT
jgi:hypothetical protein